MRGKDVGRRAGHACAARPRRRRGERAGAEHEHTLPAIGPRVKAQNGFERMATHDQCIHRRHELIVAVGFATVRRQEVEITVDASDEAVEAGANEYRCLHLHRRALMLSSPPGNEWRDSLYGKCPGRSTSPGHGEALECANSL